MADTGTFLGQRIREMREAAGLAQSDITGVHRTLLGAIERGERTCTVRTLEKIARALRCEVADFFVPGASGSPQQQLGRNIAALAADATEEEMERFREIAIVFFRRTKGRNRRKAKR